MGFLVRNMIYPIYGKRAAECVDAFSDRYAGNDVMGFMTRFKNIAAAAKPKFIWAALPRTNDQIKANMVAVLGAQFKPPGHAHMPQSASLSILQSLDGFCVANTPKEDVTAFLKSWENTCNPKSSLTDQDICDFLNIIRLMRHQLESFIDANPMHDQIAKCEKLQSHLCYIEAGFYRVSQVELLGDVYCKGPRDVPARINPLEQGFFACEQPDPSVHESKSQNTIRELKHDILITGLFVQEEQAFSELGLRPFAQCKQSACRSRESLHEHGIVSARDKLAQDYYRGLDDAAHQYHGLERTFLQSYDASPVQNDVEDSLHHHLSGSSSLKVSGSDNASAHSDSVSIRSDSSHAQSNDEGVDLTSDDHRSGLIEVPGMSIPGKMKWFGDAFERIRVFLKNMVWSVNAMAVHPDRDLDLHFNDVLADNVSEIESGIDRILGHQALKSPETLSKDSIQDIRHMLKSRLEHYLSREGALLESYPDMDRELIMRLEKANHTAQSALDALSHTSRSPRWNKLKQVWGGRSHQQSIRRQLTGLSCQLHDHQRSAIEVCFLEKTQDRDADHDALLAWLRHDYGLQHCSDGQKLDAFLGHLRSLEKSLPEADMQRYCVNFSGSISDFPINSPSNR